MQNARRKAARSLAPVFALTILASETAAAVEHWTHALPDGRLFATLHIYQKDEAFCFPQFGDEPVEGTADWNLSSVELERIAEGLSYHALLLKDAVVAPADIALVTIADQDDNASAYSPVADGAQGLTLLGAQLTGRIDSSLETAFITIDRTSNEDGNWYAGAMQTLPANNDRPDLSSTILHEMVHALGLIASTSNDETDDDGYVAQRFDEKLSAWTAGLRDVDGDAARPGMAITHDGASGSSDTFDLYSLAEREDSGIRPADSGVYYTSENVQEVLDGARIYLTDNDEADAALPGLPVNAWENDGEGGLMAELSHIELQNSLMSHQNWRNWNTLMEAEIAVMQDMGYAIDRRDWFGRSIYNSNSVIVNDSPYCARNDAGDGWIAGAANTNPWGIGLHVYGRDNDITQAADILTEGAYALGIRLEGSNNTLRIDSQTTVRSDGAYGRALAVSYGQGHEIVHQGTLVAAGGNGVAALFSFGDNEMGENYEQRGSYIYEVRDWSVQETSMVGTNPGDIGLDGALVKSFDVSGVLAGGAAAIGIDDNALVSEIRFLQGASLAGDIVSLWNPLAERVQFLDSQGQTAAIESIDKGFLDGMITHLRFGLTADASGRATETPDAGFRLRWNGNLYGAAAQSGTLQDAQAAAATLTLEGGSLTLNGTAKLLAVTVRPGAVLEGEGSFVVAPIGSLLPEEASDKAGIEADVLASYGTFTNLGTISPGDGIGTMRVQGRFEMGDAGLLVFDFDAAGRTDRLVLTELADATSLTEEHVVFRPAADYYAGRGSFELSGLVEVDGSSPVLSGGGFASCSPTLSFSGSAQDGTFVYAAERAGDAYSRYALSASQRDVARAFDRHADSAQGAIRELVAALDFSDADGSALPAAFEQLGPGVYARAGRAALSAQRIVTEAVLGQIASPGFDETIETDARVFAMPLGGYDESEREGVRSNYAGLVAGVRTQRAHDGGIGTYGGYAAVLSRKDKFSNAAGSRSESESVYFGVHGRYDPNTLPGSYVFGLAQAVVENTDVDRRVSFAGFSDHADVDWTSWGGSIAFGAGQSFVLASNLRFGPEALLAYGFMHLPDATESSAHGAALRLESETYRSLRSSLGLRAAARFEGDSGQALLQARLMWNHEFLDDYGTSEASFAAWRDARFAQTQSVSARDTGEVCVALTARPGRNFEASLGAGAEFGNGISSVRGHATLKWILR